MDDDNLNSLSKDDIIDEILHILFNYMMYVNKEQREEIKRLKSF